MHHLKTTNAPLKDIIIQVGYLDTPNFIRKFKKETAIRLVNIASNSGRTNRRNYYPIQTMNNKQNPVSISHDRVFAVSGFMLLFVYLSVNYLSYALW